MHLGDHRHGQLVDGQHHAAALGEQVLIERQLGVGGHVLEVVTGAEGLAVGREHHDADRLVLGDAAECLLQRGQHLVAEGVEALGIVQRQRDHATGIALCAQRAFGKVGDVERSHGGSGFGFRAADPHENTILTQPDCPIRASTVGRS